MKKVFGRLVSIILAAALALCAASGIADGGDERTVYPQGEIYTFDHAGPTGLLGAPLPFAEQGTALGDGSRAVSEDPDDRLPDEEGAASFAGGEAATFDRSGTPQLTMDDIQAMNGDSQVIGVFNNDGYLSMLLGRFYDKKVTNYEEGILSIQGMAALLGMGKGSEFFIVSRTKHNSGYTFYTYQQRYGGTTLRYATLRIAVDPDGYTAGLSCSFRPNAGVKSQDPAVSAEEAEQLIKKRFADKQLTYYPGTTVRSAIPVANRIYNCWVVYSSNPNMTSSFDMPYLEHFITTNGEYVASIPANTFVRDSAEALDNSAYFEGLETQVCRAAFTLEDGSRRDVEVPVSYNPKDGKYYLIDPTRKIAVAQYYDFNYRDCAVNFVTSDRPDGWSQNNLMAYANYIAIYDFYADHGIRSVDGFGTPILITVGWCDEYGAPVDNACFYGVIMGWACFGVSDINHYCDCVDVMGHEYTHGITRQSMQGVLYQNETGAINEAYSDIMGNLIEMSGNFTDDRTWLLGEKTGSVSRDMGDPNRFRQPAYVGDMYYKASVLSPDSDINDNGGVHDNNSLLGHIAYLMDQEGMTYEQQFSMWLVAIEMMTPLSDYSDVHGALLFSLKVNGMMEEYGPALNRAFEAAGLNEDWNETYLTTKKKGCGRVTLNAGKEFAQAMAELCFYDVEGQYVDCAYQDANGVFSALLPAGTYMTRILVADNSGGYTWYNYTGTAWQTNAQFATFKVEDGGSVTLRSWNDEEPKKEYGEIELFEFDGGYFKLPVPNGWRIEVNGQYTNFSFKLFDPEDPSTQVFYYGDLAPYHKSAMAKAFWVSQDQVYDIGPVLTSPDILGVLDTWPLTIEGQKKYEKQYYTDLYDMQLLGGSYFDSGIFDSIGVPATESVAVITCGTNWDDDCLLTVMCALVDFDVKGKFGGRMYYDCMNLYGILAPQDRYDEALSVLRHCLEGMQFTTAYRQEAQKAGMPIADNATIRQRALVLGNVLEAAYEAFGG